MILDLAWSAGSGGASVLTFSLASTDANNNNNNNNNSSNVNNTSWDIFLIMEDDSAKDDDDKGGKDDHKDYGPHVDTDAPLVAVDATTTIATMPTTQGQVLADNPDGDDKVEVLGSVMPVPLRKMLLTLLQCIPKQEWCCFRMPNSPSCKYIPFVAASNVETAPTSASKQDDDGHGGQDNGNSRDGIINTVEQRQPLDTPLRNCKDLPIWNTTYSRLVFWVNLISIALCTLAGAVHVEERTQAKIAAEKAHEAKDDQAACNEEKRRSEVVDVVMITKSVFRSLCGHGGQGR
jgi:hypothetical protein